MRELERRAYRFPCALAVLGATPGHVDEHQVDVIQLRLGQTLVNLGLGLVVADVEDLGSEEDLISWD